MRKGGQIQRERQRRKEIKRVLIVTEGEITEVQYLQGLVQELRATGISVVPYTLHKGGGEPSLVLKTALDRAADGDYEAVWIVVDVDEHSSLDQVLHRCAGGAATAVVSHPEFGVWLLWHLEQTSAPQTASSLKKALRRHGFTGACKHLPVNFPFHKVDEATAFASHVDRAVGQDERGINPSSAMPHLVELLRGNVPLSR
jgi:hypothetical protein